MLSQNATDATDATSSNVATVGTSSKSNMLCVQKFEPNNDACMSPWLIIIANNNVHSFVKRISERWAGK